ncbi:sodium Bile acid symporter family protein [Asticcacaulis biprosthecium C19]|uniref:Sodium Bile acid symporter family protein n=1 Tax=Asticcacaulis biprosthecium C19 TaxID=715226 RepID=F4QHC6_9CAUL|nr:bile acid:sodium symporter family protein [Asticcacaulis biprosthecium]EGF92663.1 sodium Bile acid symporter family protein [Asticcacaulis biprosthecium C19]
MKFLKLDGFVAAMLGAVVLGLLFPQFGAKGGILHLDIVTKIGIALVFFLHGANLSPHAVKAGAANWRLHLFVHAATFILFPAIGFAVFFGTQGILPSDVRLGFFYLCALPSTISSSVAMTALGKGNVPGAVFDATLSGLIGMVITPLLVSMVAHTATGGQLDVLPAIRDVAITLLLPFLAGQLCRPLLKDRIARHKSWITRADRTVIILIVYAAFCESTKEGIWTDYNPLVIVGILGMVSALLAVVLVTTRFAARALVFPREDEVAAVFCGSKKSLANGAPIAAVLFAGHPAMGMIMLPIMLYHQLQLIVCSILARRYAEAAERQ